jgi:hypothetical protein
MIADQRGPDDSLDLLSGNQVVVDKRPININVSYHGPKRHRWEGTPDYYWRQFDGGFNRDSDYNRCHGNSMNWWYRTNTMRDLDPPSTLDGDRIYLTGRRWRQGSGNMVESMTNTMLYPDQRTPWMKVPHDRQPSQVHPMHKLDTHTTQVDPSFYRDASKSTFNRLNHQRN